MGRWIEIFECRCCPHRAFRLESIDRPYCKRTGKVISNAYKIPKWCPLLNEDDFCN